MRSDSEAAACEKKSPPRGPSNVVEVNPDGQLATREMTTKTKETTMANFLYLFRGGMGSTLSPEQMQQHMQKWNAWMKGLAERGTFKAGEPLENGGKVITGKKKVVTDGPFAEAKDLVGGYLIVSARNLDDATEIAHGCPIFDHDGVVEVRAIREMNL
jgi:hypothetical protein